MYLRRRTTHFCGIPSDSQYVVDNKKIKLTQKPTKFHGNLYLPASFVNATIGDKVKLDSKQKTIYVNAKVYEPETLNTKAK
ncbi:stalk domain-containing protein [Domibacillus epiphyticus]|uniref:stalk domain-containing protein n=1 Tax=Domibacillus epiphyticus TaxID=1714355 RepID=UPI0009FB1279